MQHWELLQDSRHKTQTYNIYMTKHSYFTYTLVRHNTHKTQYPSCPLHKHTPYFNIPRLKNTIFNNGHYTTNIPTDPHTISTTDIKTNMHNIHTSIVSRHLATKDNNKILRTPPLHISSSEEILLRLTRRTLGQLRTTSQLSCSLWKSIGFVVACSHVVC